MSCWTQIAYTYDGGVHCDACAHDAWIDPTPEGTDELVGPYYTRYLDSRADPFAPLRCDTCGETIVSAGYSDESTSDGREVSSFF